MSPITRDGMQHRLLRRLRNKEMEAPLHPEPGLALTPTGFWRRVAHGAEGFTCSLDFASYVVRCSLAKPRSLKWSPTDQRTDALSLSGDWKAVGDYISSAMDTIEEEVSLGASARG